MGMQYSWVGVPSIFSAHHNYEEHHSNFPLYFFPYGKGSLWHFPHCFIIAPNYRTLTVFHMFWSFWSLILFILSNYFGGPKSSTFYCPYLIVYCYLIQHSNLLSEILLDTLSPYIRVIPPASCQSDDYYHCINIFISVVDKNFQQEHGHSKL